MRLAAVDLGASSGRVIVGTEQLALTEVHRFANGPVSRNGALRWDAGRLRKEIRAGLAGAGPLDAIGIDSWAVDHGLLGADGELLADPWCYRDERTAGVPERVRAVVSDQELYATTGLQHLPFNTLYQLAAEPDLTAVATMLLIPDLVAHWLTGSVTAEATNASTTQLYDVRTRAWATGLAGRVGVPARILPPLVEPGTVLGRVREGPAAGTPVIAVGSHDTASAVVGVPFADPRRAAYISSGTWSLVGVELPGPVLTEAARLANFTNEGGVDATTRFLRNVMGLWVLGETMRAWRTTDLTGLLAAAAAVPAFGPVVDVDAPRFLPPGDMPARLRAAAGAPLSSPGELVRCILESLALAYRRTVRQAAELSGQPVDVVHVVGGGARNTLLCQLTADACGVPVLAGPVEATALGNVLVQARALGADLPDLAAMRARVAATQPVVRYEPAGPADRWDALESRVSPA